MGYEEVCETSLVLELGHHEYRPESSSDFDDHQEIKKKKSKKMVTLQYDLLLPSLTLGRPTSYQFPAKKIDVCKVYGDRFTDTLGHASNSRHSTAVSSFSNSSSGVKREKEVEVDVERVSPRVLVINEEDEEASARKKLRLTKEQGLILENSFKDHATLNPKQKQALARQLNLRTRQVEVWFQNRRARTKLKKTEVECELLKKCCGTLADENKRLQKELQDLKALKLPTSFYMQLPAANLTICPSCQTIAGSGGEDNGSSKSHFVIKPKPHHFYRHHFTNPSTTC